METRTEIDTLLKNTAFIITYKPLRTEVPASDFYTLSDAMQVYEIPPRAALDPMEEAQSVRKAAGTKEAIVLLPGRKFDASGTRLGQGGGWYDRFLAAVPREWLRVGFCYDDQLSLEPLTRENWDQAMDYVVVVNRKTGGSTLLASE